MRELCAQLPIVSMISLRMLEFAIQSPSPPLRGNAGKLTDESSGRLGDSYAGSAEKDCLSSNKNWAGTVHLHLRALLHRDTLRADVLALARLEHGHREPPRRSPGGGGGDLRAWLMVVERDYGSRAIKEFICNHDI